MRKRKKSLYELFIKRPMDIFFSGIAIIILSPVLGISALLVRIKLGSPVLFKQARPGKDEKIFYLYKFRSMTNATDKDGKLLPDSERLTKFGKLLRKTSIDELPELINILKGDMSIVGPRPLSIYYLPHYGERAKSRHDVRPGLTGLAQINGRNNLPWDDRFALDAKYVENVTFINDVRIILGTVLKVLKASDISVRGTTKVYDFGTYKIIQEEGADTMKNYEMTYPEIGSYFWLNKEEITSEKKEISFLPVVSDSAFTFSGRTAIEIALQDMLKSKQIRRVYVPSYCCVSMLQSFIDHGVEYVFYDVKVENGKVYYNVDVNADVDMFMFMQYFSMRSDDLSNLIFNMKKRGVIILEDITHSLFNDNSYDISSDYLVASLRKWCSIPAGGWVGKISGMLEVKPNIDSNYTVAEKLNGMHMKYQYILGKELSKEGYLQLNSKFDNDLIHVDRMLKLDDVSMRILGTIDITDIKEKRRKNAKKLRELLSDISEITLPDIDFDKSVPLFYPIFLKKEKRDSLRSFLVQNGMYCPVHWPEVMGASAGIRENELSLICDQRYEEKDMYAISACIHDWFKMNLNRV